MSLGHDFRTGSSYAFSPAYKPGEHITCPDWRDADACGNGLHFDVEIVDVREASAEEIAHKHVHGDGGPLRSFRSGAVRHQGLALWIRRREGPAKAWHFRTEKPDFSVPRLGVRITRDVWVNTSRLFIFQLTSITLHGGRQPSIHRGRVT